MGNFLPQPSHRPGEMFSFRGVQLMCHATRVLTITRGVCSAGDLFHGNRIYCAFLTGSAAGPASEEHFFATKTISSDR